MTPEHDILKALSDRVEIVGAELELPLAWAGKSFDAAAADHKYIRVNFVPNTTNRILIGSKGPSQILGLLQLSLYWPKGDFEHTPREVAGAIVEAFPCDLKLRSGGVTVRITQRPSAREMLTEKEALQIPVMIYWEAYA